MADVAFGKWLLYLSVAYVVLLTYAIRALGRLGFRVRRVDLLFFHTTVAAAAGAGALGTGIGWGLGLAPVHALGYGAFFAALAATGWVVSFSGNWGILLGVIAAPITLIVFVVAAPSAMATDDPNARDLQVLWILAAAQTYLALAISRWTPGPWARWREHAGVA